MSDPVVVDPAPPDLAAGLDRLALVLGGPGAADAGLPVLLVAADLVVHPAALADLAEDPRAATAALVSRAAAAADEAAGATIPAVRPVPDLRLRAGRVVAAGTSTHQVDGADANFVGALRIAAADRPAAVATAAAMSTHARRLGWSGDPLAYLLLGLVRTGVPVGTSALDPWPWARGSDPGGDSDVTATLRGQLAAMTPRDVHRTRLARAGKTDDGLVATFVSRPVARRLTPLALCLGLTPNQVTLVSVTVGLAAAGLFATGDPLGLVAGALALQLSLVLDCVDGDVARYTRRFTPMGAWLDASTDRLKEFAGYAGLAAGAAAANPGSTGDRAGWVLAAAMITLQTSRHAIDYTFTAVKELREAAVVTAALDDPADPQRPAGGDPRAARALELSRRSSASRPAVTWLKKLLHLGIGERWALISLLAALGRPEGALVALLVLGTGSLLYTSAGRTLRARSWSTATPPGVAAREREIVAAQVDGGPLLPQPWAARVAGGPGPGSAPNPFLWARPALLRAFEYAGLLALTSSLAGPRVGAATCLLLLVVASHHYDDLYRVLQRLRPPSAASRVLGLGWPGRLLVVAALAATGAPGGVGAVAEGGLWVLVAALGMLFLVVEPVRVLREVRAAPSVTHAAATSPGVPGGGLDG